MQLSGLNFNPHGGQSLRYIIHRAIVDRFFPPPVYDHHTLLFLDRFHGPTHRQVHSRFRPEKNNEVYNVLRRDCTGEVYAVCRI